MAIGIGCVLVTTALTTASIPLMRNGIQAITDVAGFTEQKIFSSGEIDRISQRTGKTTREVVLALSPIQHQRDLSGVVLSVEEQKKIADSLGVKSEQLSSIIQDAREHATPSPTPADALRQLGLTCLFVVGVYGLKYWFTRGQSYYLAKAASRLASDLRIRLYAKLQRLPISYFGSRRSGSIQSVLTNDVGVYQAAVTIIKDSIDGPLKAIGSFGYILWTQWQLGALTLLFLPPMVIAIQRNSKKMKSAQANVQNDLAILNGMTLESLQGTRVVKAFAAEDRMEEEYRGLVEKTFSSQMRAARRNATLRPLVEMIGACALAAFLYASGILAFHGNLQVADLVALVYALDVINQGSRNIASVNNTYAQVQAASERIYSEVLDVPEEHHESLGAKTLATPKGRIEFQGVSFAYPDGTQALEKVNFVLEPGTSLALVGPSGAGKSTIADLLLRFYDPSEGVILFDGVDIRELDLAWLRKQIGVVPQQTFLFAGTIADNICMGKPDASAAEIEEAAIAAHASVFVDTYEEKYNYLIGEQGGGLSGGERQRVAIARALVRKPTLLLLDEATSALDATSEKAVTEALDEIMQQRTTLFIAHRLTTAARADKILVLRRGEIVEQGTHRELMDANGAYAGLFRAFSQGVLEDGLG